MKKKFFIFIFAAIFLATIFCGGCQQSNNSSENTYPEINWPALGSANHSDVKKEVNENFKIDSSDVKVNVYKVIKPDIDRIISDLNKKIQPINEWTYEDDRVYYADENQLIEVDTNTGYWFFQSRKEYTSLYNSTTPAKISSEQAINIAKKVAEEYNVDLQLFSDIQVGNIEYTPAQSIESSEESSIIIGYDIYFYPIIDGKNVWGVSRFNVTIDGNGNFVSVSKRFPELSFYSVENTISPDVALNQVIENKGHLTTDTPSEADSAIIDEYKIVYYIDVESLDSDYFCQPVYAFKGHYLSESGQQLNDSSFTALTPAIK